MHHLTTDSRENQSPNAQTFTFDGHTYRAEALASGDLALLSEDGEAVGTFSGPAAIRRYLRYAGNYLHETVPPVADWEYPGPLDTCTCCGEWPAGYSLPGQDEKFCWEHLCQVYAATLGGDA